MRSFKSTVIMGLVFLAGAASAQAASLTDQQARAYAERGLAQFNATVPAGNATERLFEGYRAVTAQNCKVTRAKITCEFDVTESWDSDADVYTPNTLTVVVDRASDTLSVEIEWGC